MNVRIVLLPEEHDPDTFARAHTSEELRDYIAREAQDFLGFKARLLLGDVTDPMQRSEAIRAMVESISLIPDNIKRQEYTKYCAEIMQTSADTLNSEVALMRAGSRAGREGRDFVRRHQSLEAQREMSERQVTPSQPNKEHLPLDSSVGTSMYTLEKEIVKYLLKYGHLNFSVLDDQTKEYFDYNVAEHIFSELDTDCLRLSYPVFSTIYDEYHAEYDRQGVGVEVSVHRFVNHHDPEVSRMAVDLLTSDDNYQISRIWEQKDVHNESVQEQLADGVPSVVALFKWRTVDQRIIELRKRLQTPGISDDEMSSVLAALTKFLAVRGALANVTNRLI
jgi:DNA primase